MSFPAGILPELEHHLDTFFGATFSGAGSDGLVFVNEHSQQWRRGNLNPAVQWRQACTAVGAPDLQPA